MIISPASGLIKGENSLMTTMVASGTNIHSSGHFRLSKPQKQPTLISNWGNIAKLLQHNDISKKLFHHMSIVPMP